MGGERPPVACPLRELRKYYLFHEVGLMAVMARRHCLLMMSAAGSPLQTCIWRAIFELMAYFPFAWNEPGFRHFFISLVDA
jgi:hypothetical protein